MTFSYRSVSYDDVRALELGTCCDKNERLPCDGSVMCPPTQSEAADEGLQLKEALEARGLNIFICDQFAGSNLMDIIYSALDAATLVVILASITYGRRTSSGFSTYEELYALWAKQPSPRPTPRPTHSAAELLVMWWSRATCSQYTLDEGKPFYLIKMCERWSEPHVRGQLGARTMYEKWMPGGSMPDGLVDRVMARLDQARLEQARSPMLQSLEVQRAGASAPSS